MSSRPRSRQQPSLAALVPLCPRRQPYMAAPSSPFVPVSGRFWPPSPPLVPVAAILGRPLPPLLPLIPHDHRPEFP